MDPLTHASLTSPQPSASAESLASPSGDHLPPPAADSRPAQGRRTDNLEPHGSGQRAAISTPRVLILSCEGRKLSSLSPFQRKEGCDRLGKVLRCEKLRDGGIEVEFANDADAKRALTATYFQYTSRLQGRAWQAAD